MQLQKRSEGDPSGYQDYLRAGRFILRALKSRHWQSGTQALRQEHPTARRLKEVRYALALFLELLKSVAHLLAREGIVLEALDDLVVAIFSRARKAIDDSLGN